VDGEFVEAVAGEVAAVFALKPGELLVIELGVVTEYLRRSKRSMTSASGILFQIILGDQPSRQR